MTTVGCDPCCNIISTSQSVEATRWAVITLLCSINEALSGGGGVASNVNIADIAGTAPTVGAGAITAGTLRVTLAAATTVGIAAGTAVIGHVILDSGVLTSITNALPVGANVIGKVSIDQTTPGTTNLVALAANQSVNVAQINGVAPSMGNGGSGTGVQRVTLANDSTGIVSLTTSTASIGKLAANAAINIGDVVPVSSTTGGYTPSRVSGGLSTTVTAIKSSAQGKLGGWVLFNPNSTNAFLQIFNVATAGAVTLGTTVPVLSVGLPPFGGANIIDPTGTDFSAGIQVAATTTEAGSSALTTNITANILFK